MMEMEAGRYDMSTRSLTRSSKQVDSVGPDNAVARVENAFTWLADLAEHLFLYLDLLAFF